MSDHSASNAAVPACSTPSEVEVEVCGPAPLLRNFAKRLQPGSYKIDRKHVINDKLYVYTRHDVRAGRLLVARFNAFAAVHGRTMALARLVVPLVDPMEVWRPERPSAPRAGDARAARYPEVPPLPACWPAEFVSVVAQYARGWALRPPVLGTTSGASLWLATADPHSEAQVRALAAAHGLRVAGGRDPVVAVWRLRATGAIEEWAAACAEFEAAVNGIFGLAAVIPSERGMARVVHVADSFDVLNDELQDSYRGHAVVRPHQLVEAGDDNPWRSARRGRALALLAVEGAAQAHGGVGRGQAAAVAAGGGGAEPRAAGAAAAGTN